MNHQNLVLLRNKTRSYWYSIQPRVKAITIRASFALLLFLLLSNQEVSFHIHIGAPASITSVAETSSTTASVPMRAGLVDPPKRWWQTIKEEKEDIRQELNLANAATAVGAALTPAQQEAAANYSNLGFVVNPTYASRKKVDPKIVAFKLKKCQDYIELYRETAEEEAKLYAIPVAITLAQGLLESNVGDSKLARNDNNHFGIKCKAKCVGCRCANYTDDSKYDMFRVFDSAWYSFREHSKVLNNARYKHLKKLPRTDYVNWAHGLEAAGYATDKQYGEKLVKIIEGLNLQRFDQ
ncbi:MAG: glycoside hydrolase family 73 protein [Aureispira sp.]